jgi:hypothetical protein
MPRDIEVIKKEQRDLHSNYLVWNKLMETQHRGVHPFDPRDEKIIMPINTHEHYLTFNEAAMNLLLALQQELDEARGKETAQITIVNGSDESENVNENGSDEKSGNVNENGSDESENVNENGSDESGGGKRQKRRKSKKHMKKIKSGKNKTKKSTRRR